MNKNILKNNANKFGYCVNSYYLYSINDQSQVN